MQRSSPSVDFLQFRARSLFDHVKFGVSLVVDIDDPQFGDGAQIGDTTYEEFIASGDPDYRWDYPADEWNAISLNYTSGTTGNPKGVVFHHRGATLAAYGNATQ